MRALVTGATGFLGTKLCELLEKEYKTLPMGHNDETDLIYSDGLGKLITGWKPDTVIHLAARVGGIGANKSFPSAFLVDNLQMGINTIHSCFLNKVEKFVLVGTVCSYPKFCSVPFREEEIWNGYPEETNAPYGIAKRTLMVMLDAYREQFGFNGVTVIPTNLYGPGDKFGDDVSHVIPALIKKFVRAAERNEKEVVVWGDGLATREFLYVDDAAAAIKLIAENENKETVYNVGSGVEIRIKELAMIIARLCGYTGEIVYDLSKPNGQPRRRVSVERISKEFGWTAKIQLEEGLQKTIEWYKRMKMTEKSR